MKTALGVVLMVGAWIAASGCSESTQPQDLSAPVVSNTPPKVFAGRDVSVPVPSPVVLSGFATDAESGIERYAWKKISGPDSYFIDSPNSPLTEVTRLERGIYEFELTVTDKGGLTARDAVSVYVYDPPAQGGNELVFSGLEWQCPMGCSVSIQDLQSFVPDGAAIRVYVMSGGQAGWIEAKPENQWTAAQRYVYGIDRNTLWIYANDESGSAEVMVTY